MIFDNGRSLSVRSCLICWNSRFVLLLYYEYVGLTYGPGDTKNEITVMTLLLLQVLVDIRTLCKLTWYLLIKILPM